MNKLTVGSCFSGICGLELGLEWTGGFETRWQIENDEYASRVLAKHWPDVKRYSDIRDVANPEPVDVICGGFPCQDVSLAGARKGLEGKRSTLWGEMFRLVCEVRPRWVVAENVPGLLSSDDGRFFGNILRDLAGAGYDAEWGVLSAAGVGAPHLRRRVFIIAHPRLFGSKEHEKQAAGIEQLCEVVANTEGTGLKRSRIPIRTSSSLTKPKRNGKSPMASAIGGRGFGGGIKSGGTKEIRSSSSSSRSSWWESEPDVGRVASRVPSRVDRLRCLGNAVVPQVAQKIGEMILNFVDPATPE